MADQVDVSGGAPGTAGKPAVAEKPRQFGLTAAMALIVGSIIGVGIFNLPTSLAFYGPITLVSMALTTVGALALALLFASLSRRLPADGGPYAYARVAFGNRLGFANAWSYWITAWAGNAAIAVGWVLYVEHFINTGHNKLWSVLLVLVGLWIPAAINLSGVKNMGSVQVVTTIVKFAALAFMSTVGLFFISSANFTPWNVSKESAINAIGGGMAIALFSYLGVETAAVAAAKVRNPDRNIPRATILGTIATAVVYMLSLIAVFGIVPTSKLATATAPFSDAANAIFGGTWAGNVMAIAVIISGFGALNGWTMICAEMPLAAASDGLFPERFKRMSKNGRARLRHRRLDRAGLGRDDHQLSGLERRDGLHHPGPDDRHHRRHPVRLLGARAAEMALDRPPHAADPALCPGHDRRRAVAGVLDPVHLVLAQHRSELLGVLGAVHPGRGRAAARDPRLPGPAPPHDPAGARPALPVTPAVTPRGPGSTQGG